MQPGNCRCHTFRNAGAAYNKGNVDILVVEQRLAAGHAVLAEVITIVGRVDDCNGVRMWT